MTEFMKLLILFLVLLGWTFFVYYIGYKVGKIVGKIDRIIESLEGKKEEIEN